MRLSSATRIGAPTLRVASGSGRPASSRLDRSGPSTVPGASPAVRPATNATARSKVSRRGGSANDDMGNIRVDGRGISSGGEQDRGAREIAKRARPIVHDDRVGRGLARLRVFQ